MGCRAFSGVSLPVWMTVDFGLDTVTPLTLLATYSMCVCEFVSWRCLPGGADGYRAGCRQQPV